MSRFAKRCLAMILSILLALSVTPINSYAAETAGTYVQINTIEELTSGKYVMIVNSGYAAGTFDAGTKWLSAMPVTPTDSKVTNPDNTLVWDITVTGAGTALTDANGITVKPSGRNDNKIAAGDYVWAVEFNNGTFSFKGVGEDIVTLASNKDSEYKFRAYKNKTVTDKSYPAAFTLYKLDNSTPPVTPKAAMPTANIPSGTVVSGSAIELSCGTPGASIHFTTVSPSAISLDYTQPIIINADTSIYAQATAEGYEDSDIAKFDYVIEKTDPTIFDPITTIPAGANTVLEAAQTVTGQAITVVGQLVYRYGNYNTPNTAILEDVINGKIYALQIYNALSEFNIGDIVKLKGTTSVYGGVPQLQNLTTRELITPAAGTQLINVQAFASITELKGAKNTLLSEWVVIRNVTLGTYKSSGSTTVTDSNGDSIEIYNAATYPNGVAAGDKVDLYACLSKYDIKDQLRVGSSTDYVVTSDTKPPVITMPVFTNAEKGKDYRAAVTITDNVAVTEAKLTYTINELPNTVAMVQNTSDPAKWEVTIPGSTFTSEVSGFTIVVTAKDLKGNEANSDAIVITVIDKPQITKVSPVSGGYTGDDKKPIISVTAVNLGAAPTAKLTLKTGETVLFDAVPMSFSEGTFRYTPSNNLTDMQYTATVVITREDGKAITYDWLFTVGTPKYSLYFGQLHSHTTYSDGPGSLDDALTYINNISKSDNIDFVAFTDHSNYFDTTAAANPEAALYNKNLMTTGSLQLWNEFHSKIDAFNASAANNGVIALDGFEMTWSGGPGHINTWNTEGIVSRNNKTLNSKTNDSGLKAYYTLLSQPEGVNSISQFNHPGKTFGTFSDLAYWDPVIDSRITLLEVGNGEGAIGSGGYFPSYNYYTIALDKGWHVAPTNSQDNHKGKWGNSNDARDVILTDNFTEQGIYDALKNRKVYATEDKNLEITYTVNNEFMGTIIKEIPDNLKLKVILNDPDDVIQKAEVIANSGRVVYSWDVNAQSKELNVTLQPDYSYYYIRVKEIDGDIAVTAPVWVGSAKLLGISNVESSTSTPVTGEKMTIKTTLFNSEAEDAQIKSLTYKLDGTITDQQMDAGTIAKGTATVINYDFTPVKAKMQTITVEAVLTTGGLDYSFIKDISLDVRDANKLVYIGIDGSHYNEYVAGNYKDSMGNFSSLAAQSNVRCVILNSSDELLAAAKNTDGKYKMLILTAPSRRDGITLREPYAAYTDAEIAAIKGFSEAGGSLMICGWSDNYESYKPFQAGDHMAAQQNKLLTAVGSSLRISDDGAYDDVLNAGGSEGNKARLYLTTYNWDNSFTKGIVFDKNHPNDNMYTQRFSQYGGATIYSADKDGNPASVLPASVSSIVYGHNSTYSKDCDNDGLGGSSTPKYEYAKDDNRVMVLASETVTHTNGTQSLVIADGAAFMSNFEIQATVSDTNSELNFSNYTILQNLIQYVNPIRIDTIADVQKETSEGVKFTVEGIVTSNSSGYDKNTAFFDCIYLQDGTAGINAFPVSGEFKAGQKVRITGTTSSYQGERQLNVSSISLIDSNVQNVEPLEVTAKQINDRTYLGSLVKITGKVEKFEQANGVVQTILVKDKSGDTARIFIDGYITTDKEIKNLTVGNQITAVGLSSYDNTFAGLAARLRIRDRADIVCTPAAPTDPPTPTPTPTPTLTPTPTPTPIPVKETVVDVNEAESNITKGTATVKIEISENTLKDKIKDGNTNIKINIGRFALKKVLTDSRVKKGVVIDVLIPALKDADVNKIVLTTGTLLLAKKSGQNLTIHIINGDEKGYTIYIPASELKKLNAKSKELDLTVLPVNDINATDITGVIRIGTEGMLPAGMVITVPVTGTLSVSAGRKAYLYHKNAKTGALEEVPNNPRTISGEGTLKFSVIGGGDYVICTEKAKDAVRLTDRINVSVKASINKGDKTTIAVNLPPELSQVTKFISGDPIGKEEAKVTYKIDNRNIATVSDSGIVTAIKKGTVKITVSVTLENRQKKSFNISVTVK